MDTDIIYQLLKEVRDDQKELRESLSDHRYNSESERKYLCLEVTDLRKNLSENNNILIRLTKTVEEHQQRSTMLEKVVMGTPDEPGHRQRIVALEEPVKVKAYISNKVKVIATLVGVIMTSIVAIIKFYHVF